MVLSDSQIIMVIDYWPSFAKDDLEFMTMSPYVHILFKILKDLKVFEVERGGPKSFSQEYIWQLNMHFMKLLWTPIYIGIFIY